MSKSEGPDRWIVTSATDRFLPGAKALYNSAKRWCPDVGFGVLFYTDDPERWTAERVRDHVGPDAVVHINYPVQSSPDFGTKYNRHMIIGPEMYSRLLIPRIFSGRVLYCDADCLILSPIDEAWQMDLRGYPSACVDRGDVGWRNDQTAMASGVVLIDCEEWNRVDIVGKCLALQASDPPRDNVEGLISRAHGADFLKMDPIWQNLAYYGCLCQRDKVLHYAGFKPWIADQPGWWVNYSSIWTAYHKNEIETADRLQALLPGERPSTAFKNRQNRLPNR